MSLKIEPKSEGSIPAPKVRKKQPEEDVKHSLSLWLSPYCEIFWEKKNKFGMPVFKSLLTEKPDLVLKRTDPYGKTTYFALEVKDGGSNQNVYDSVTQLVGYAKADSVFHVGGNVVHMDGYFIATQHSVAGRLTQYENIKDKSKFSTGRKGAISRGEIPANEYAVTEAISRILWRVGEKEGVKSRFGVLLSSILITVSANPKPLFLYKNTVGDSAKQNMDIWMV